MSNIAKLYQLLSRWKKIPIYAHFIEPPGKWSDQNRAWQTRFIHSQRGKEPSTVCRATSTGALENIKKYGRKRGKKKDFVFFLRPQVGWFNLNLFYAPRAVVGGGGGWYCAIFSLLNGYGKELSYIIGCTVRSCLIWIPPSCHETAFSWVNLSLYITLPVIFSSIQFFFDKKLTQ